MTKGFKLEIDRKQYKKLEAQLEKTSKFMSEKSVDSMEQIANEIMTESKTEVPTETGALRDSGFVARRNDGVTFGYGGENDVTNPKTGKSVSEYMLPVHDDLSAEHTNGKAKFFEDPVNKNLVRIEETMKNFLERTLSGFFKRG